MTAVAVLGSWLLTALAVGCGLACMRRLGRARELAVRASHELRGPLTAVQLTLESMAGELGPGRMVALETQLCRARLALDDLDVAPSGAHAPDRLEPVAVAALVAQLGLAWRPVATARGLELRVAGGGVTGTLLADRTRLTQAAGNLLANALEHGAGPVELRARASAGRLRLEVHDSGPGLPATLAALARRPLAQRGRGLAIATGIAERHGGRLTSAPSPCGAAVVLELPLLPERPVGPELGDPS